MKILPHHPCEAQIGTCIGEGERMRNGEKSDLFLNLRFTCSLRLHFTGVYHAPTDPMT